MIGHPVAKTAVVAAAVTPGRGAPVAKTAVVAAAVTPGRGAPVAKTAVVAAAVTPGSPPTHLTDRWQTDATGAFPDCTRPRAKAPYRRDQVPCPLGRATTERVEQSADVSIRLGTSAHPSPAPLCPALCPGLATTSRASLPRRAMARTCEPPNPGIRNHGAASTTTARSKTPTPLFK